MKTCDIIIPIYNAYECVIDCVKSVEENTNLHQNRLILINDQSSDERIKDLLDKYQKEHQDWIIIHNSKNYGFVKTVNIGMKQSKKNDVLLLNSDTIVTKGWLEKLKKCAYSSKNVATVTPLSNKATLTSVPVPFVRNEIPTGYTIQDMANLVEEVSSHEYRELPTGHGFCLYIKREILNEIGYFDEQTFGKGYGEENDFCFRALDYGYRHLLCDDVYIYHKESQSFSKSKIALQQQGTEALKKRYPEYVERLNLWCQQNQISYCAQKISAALGMQDNRENILYLIHDWHDVKNHVGGTTLHTYDLIQNLRKKYNIHVLAPEKGMYQLFSYYAETETVMSFPKQEIMTDFCFYQSDYKQMILKIIDLFSIHIIHVQHMKNHFFDIADVVKQKELTLYITLHDFYCVCPIINKLYCQKEYCGDPSIEKCNHCLEQCTSLHNGMAKSWRKAWLELLLSADKIFCPSESARKEIQLTYPSISIDVIEHGSDLEKQDPYSSLNKKSKNIAFIGAIGEHKGKKIIDELIRRSRKTKNHYHLFGILADNKWKNQKYFTNHGKYTRKQLPKLLKENDIQLVCIFSICPETYCYTLTEAIACGVPVLATNLGALGERVEKDHLGWVIPVNITAKEIENKISEIFNNPKDYKEKQKNIKKYHLISTKMMSEQYKKYYDQEKRATNYQKDQIYKILRNEGNYHNQVNYYNYAWVFDTLKWKLISKVKIPRKIKKMLGIKYE